MSVRGRANRQIARLHSLSCGYNHRSFLRVFDTLEFVLRKLHACSLVRENLWTKPGPTWTMLPPLTAHEVIELGGAIT